MREKAGVHGMRDAPGFAAVWGVRDGFSALIAHRFQVRQRVDAQASWKGPAQFTAPPGISSAPDHRASAVCAARAESGKLFPKALRCQRKISLSRA